MANSWCGYIDLLATRAVAEQSSNDLDEFLDKFHSALYSAFKSSRGGKCYAFSDGAFFSFNSIDDFKPFYRAVRNELFQQRMFFRCSLIPGVISKEERHWPEKSSDPNFISMTFADEAPKAYQKENEFKGVGCAIDSRTKALARDPDLVKSYYVLAKGARAKAYEVIDFRFRDQELTSPAENSGKIPKLGERHVFEPIIWACHTAISHSEIVATYYTSAIVSAIRSTNLSTADFDGNNWQNASYAFTEMISGGVSRVLRRLPSLHLILLTCYDHFFSERNGEIPKDAEAEVVNRLMKYPKCFQNLNDVPNFVISHDARLRLVKLHVERERQEGQLRKPQRSSRLKPARRA
jgi:hypothetical protein